MDLFAQSAGLNYTGVKPHSSALLDISDSAGTHKGLLIPRVPLTSATSTTTIANPAVSLMIYNTATAGTSPDNVIPGYYYWTGTRWINLVSSSNAGTSGQVLTSNGVSAPTWTTPTGFSGWGLTGNSGTTAGTNFLGTTDNIGLAFKTNNTERVRLLPTGELLIGYSSLFAQEILGIRKDQNANTDFKIYNSTSGSSAESRIIVSASTANFLLTVASAGFTTAGMRVQNAVSLGATAGAGLNIGTENSAPLAFWTNNTERARFLSTGNFGINTTTPGAKLEVAGGTTTTGENTFKLTGSPAVSTSASQIFMSANVTPTAGAGIFDLTGFYFNIASGYTGSGSCWGLRVLSQSAGTGTDYIGGYGNIGIQGAQYGTTTGVNIAVNGSASSGSLNLGVFGRADVAKNSATNVGVMGLGLNTGTSPIQVGGYFGLAGTAPTFISSALIADNGATTSPIFIARDNGTEKFRIGDGGNVGIGTTSPDANLHIYSGNSTSSTFGLRVNSLHTTEVLGFAVRDDMQSFGKYLMLGPSVNGSETSSSIAFSVIGTTASESIRGYSSVGGNNLYYLGPSNSTSGAFQIMTSGTPVIQLYGNAANYLNTTNGLSVGSTDNARTTQSAQLFVEKADGSTNAYVNAAFSRAGYTYGIIDADGSASAIFRVKGMNAGATKIPLALGVIDYPDAIYIPANGKVGIGCTDPQYTLHVIGDIASSATVRTTNAVVTGAITSCSDVRYKKDIAPLQNVLSNVMKLQGVNYKWKKDEFKDKNFSDALQIGFIAQEIEKIYPEVVLTDVDGYKSVDYSRLTPILVEALKEQQRIIDKQQATMDKQQSSIDKLTSENTDVRNRIQKIEAMIGASQNDVQGRK